jgi:acyl dehydratase
VTVSTGFAKAGPLVIDAARVAAYLAAAGDDNPLHTDPEIACALGFASNPVPGMLLSGLAASYLEQQLPGSSVVALSSRFLAPVLTGQSIEISAKAMQVDELGAPRIVRVLLRTEGKLAAIVEITLAPPDRGGAA